MSEKLRQKVNAEEFRVDTSLTIEEVKAATRRSFEAGKRFGVSAIREEVEVADGLVVASKGMAGLKNQMDIRIGAAARPEGGTAVSLKVGDFITTRPVVLGFIPAGPKNVPALKSLKRFSEALRVELS